MQKAKSKLTSQGQVSVPATVRSFLHLVPGSMLTWSQEGDRVIVDRAKSHSTTDVHRALFPARDAPAPPPRTLAELKEGVRQRMLRRHAGG